MPRYVILPDAQRDLEQIDCYTTRTWGARQAVVYLEALAETFELLAAQPFTGRDRSWDVGPGYLSFGCKSHVVYYKKIKEGIAIAAVLHKSMVPQKHLSQRADPDGEYTD